MGHYDMASEALEHVKPLARAWGDKASTLLHEARLRWHQKDAEAASAAYNQAVQLIDNNIQPPGVFFNGEITFAELVVLRNEVEHLLGMQKTEAQQQDVEQLAELDRQIEREPENTSLRRQRAKLHAKHLKWQEARSDYEQVLQLQPENVFVRCEAANAALMTGDRDANHRHLRANLKLLEDGIDNARLAAYVAASTSLAPDVISDFHPLLPHARQLADESPNSFFDQRNLMMVHLRLKNYTDVLELTEPFLDRVRSKAQTLLVYSLHALAQYHSGHEPEAQQTLDQAEAIAEIPWDVFPNGSQEIGNLTTYVEAHVFLKEARELIRPSQPARTDTQ